MIDLSFSTSLAESLWATASSGQAVTTSASGSPLWSLPLTVLVPLLGLPAFWIVSFLIYCVKCAIFGMDRTPRIDQVVKTPWLPRIVMEFGYWMFRIPVRICIALGITPNMITFGSMLLTVLAAVAVAIGHFAFGGWVLLFAFTCDAWDGIVARATNNCTASGEFFDSTMDRYNDLFTFLGYLYYYRNQPWVFVVTALAMVGSTVVSYSRAKGDAVGINANVGYMQRHERAVWLGVSTALSPIAAAYIEPDAAVPLYHVAAGVLVLMAVMTNITAIWRIRVVMRGLSGRAAGSKPARVSKETAAPAPADLTPQPTHS
ncbi:MAG TPA: CDP-alcohol phosphatidyltransferase family protein [Pseudomonadota bacterium]|nr:CDP-alcohol phosphatidyltransferase family protein [Pseudomonadota bacterium]HNN50883.1 CDP-alcohol phosphatidyltransferase family protein [Pseudomonadota bacterium]